MSRRLEAAALALLLPAGAFAGAPPDPAYAALRAARPAGPAVAEHLTLERDPEKVASGGARRP